MNPSMSCPVIEEPTMDPKQMTRVFSEFDVKSHHRERSVNFKESESSVDARDLSHHRPGRSPRILGRSSSGRHKHHHHGRHHRRLHHRSKGSFGTPMTRVKSIIDQFELNDKSGVDPTHEPHPIFTELEELCVSQDSDDLEWKETARWVKFEEDVEIGGNRWSKPHVGALTLHSLFELRRLLNDCILCLDMVAENLEDIAELALDRAVNDGHLTYDRKDMVKTLLLKRHRHQYQYEKEEKNMGILPMVKSLTEIAKLNRVSSTISSAGKDPAGSSDSVTNDSGISTPKVDRKKQSTNSHMMKKIADNSEAFNILVGEHDGLEHTLCIFIRLEEAKRLGDLTEVPIPTRFIFLLMGPRTNDEDVGQKYHEIGRSLATVMVSDNLFNRVAYKTSKREHFLVAMDEFLDTTTVLPRGEWDPSIRIEPPDKVPPREEDSRTSKHEHVENEQDIMRKERESSGLVRSGRLFGGLVKDIKRKLPWYKSDFLDGLNIQCLASFFFIYVAVLAPLITFGGLFAEATENRISVIETLLGSSIVGMTFGFFSGQPLSILGPTGPILVFETIMFETCKGFGLEYMSFRFWIGIWAGLILLLGVATDASALVIFITRFTEENFALLIAIIFIKEAFSKLMGIEKTYPLEPSECLCIPTNKTQNNIFGTSADFIGENETSPRHYPCSFDATENGTDFSIDGLQSPGCHYAPNVFLSSVILFAGTFILSRLLKRFKTSRYLPAGVRAIISDFSVIIALVSMTLLDYFVNIPTPKLQVPTTGGIEPTWEGRTSWFVDPFQDNPWWIPLAAFFPALLATILIFMDHQITVVIVNRKENKNKKGCGYHLDLFVVAIMVIVCSVFGFPWCEASTVPSIIHVKSLLKESKTAAPGEKPQFLGILEQRVTHVTVFLFVGLSIFMAPMLVLIPMPVLFGVFLYMGIASLNGLQFFDRIKLFFMPAKHQPDMPYLRRVPLRRVHFFTIIQLACFASLWIFKEISFTRVLFPIMLVVLIGVRKALGCIFTDNELKILDDILPSFHRSQQLDVEDQGKAADTVSLRLTKSGNLELPMANGNIVKIPVDEMASGGFDISEEINKSTAWTSLEPKNGGILRHRRKPSSSRPYQPHPSRLKKMVIVQEEEEEEADRADADDDASDVSADEIGGRADLPPKPQSPKHETSLSRSNSDVGLEINFDRRRKRDNDDESMV